MIAWPVIWLLSSNAQVVPSQAMETRLVIGTGVVCRVQPDLDSQVVAAHRLGEPLTVRGMTRDRSGAAWYEVVGLRTCWVSGVLTVAFADYDSPDTALTAIAEHALALGANASFEHLVAVDNLLIERRLRRNPYFRAPAWRRSSEPENPRLSTARESATKRGPGGQPFWTSSRSLVL